MRVTKKRGHGEPEIKMLSVKEKAKMKKEENAKHTSIFARFRRKKEV
jgi:hypothetical protein